MLNTTTDIDPKIFPFIYHFYASNLYNSLPVLLQPTVELLKAIQSRSFPGCSQASVWIEQMLIRLRSFPSEEKHWIELCVSFGVPKDSRLSDALVDIQNRWTSFSTEQRLLFFNSVARYLACSPAPSIRNLDFIIWNFDGPLPAAFLEALFDGIRPVYDLLSLDTKSKYNYLNLASLTLSNRLCVEYLDIFEYQMLQFVKTLANETEFPSGLQSFSILIKEHSHLNQQAEKLLAQLPKKVADRFRFVMLNS
jgi:hypothetical protein